MAGANEAAIGLLVDLGPQLERDFPLSSRDSGTFYEERRLARRQDRLPRATSSQRLDDSYCCGRRRRYQLFKLRGLDFDCGRSISFRKLAPNGSEFVVNYPSRRMIGLKTYGTCG